MLNRSVNFYIAALLITIAGSFATWFIVNTALSADTAPVTSLTKPLK